MKESSSMVQVNDTRLHIVERGEGFPVFIIHGGPGLDHQYFGNYLDDLCDEFKLIFVDSRGEGQSDPVDYHSVSIATHAADIHELAKVLNINQYSVYGHSYGSFIALKNAIDYPEGASHIILSAGSYSSSCLAENFASLSKMIEADQPTPKGTEEGESSHSLSKAEMLKKEFIGLLPYYFSNRNDPKIKEYIQVLDKMIYTPESNEQFSKDLGGFDYCEDLALIQMPVLVMAGEDDNILPPKDSKYIHENIQNSELVIFEKAGHFMFVEDPKGHNDAVRRFLKR